jgi:hypothetical protein
VSGGALRRGEGPTKKIPTPGQDRAPAGALSDYRSTLELAGYDTKINPGSTLLLPDCYYTRRQRWHLIADATGKTLRAEEDLADLLQWALTEGLTRMILIDIHERPGLLLTIEPLKPR